MTGAEALSGLARWFQGTVKRRILAAALTVGALSVVVKLAATAKDLAVAYRFGTSDTVDAFVIAIVVPSLAVNIVANTLPVSFAPVYIAARETQGSEAARRLLATVTTVGMGLVLAASLILLGTSQFVLSGLARGFSPEKLALTRSLFFLMLPMVVLSGLIAIWSATLNAEHDFAAAALAPAVVPLLTLGMVLAAGRVWGGYAWAAGMVIGFVVHAGLLAWALARRRLWVWPRWHGVTADLRRVIAQYVPMIAGALLTTSSWAIGQAMAASLPSGSVASLNYGNKVVSMLTEVGSMAIATAVLPHFSVLAARREWGTIRATLRSSVSMTAFVAIPLTGLLIFASPLIVRLLFERGAFTAADTRVVASIQMLYLLQVPFVMIGMLFVRLASSLQQNWILLVGAMLTLPANVALNLLLMRRLGVRGIALATSIVFVISCIYLFLALQGALRGHERRFPRAGMHGPPDQGA